MTGGSGADTFALIGTANNSVAGVMNSTTVSDLGTGDKIDLSFLENKNLQSDLTSTINHSIDSTTLLMAAKDGVSATMDAKGTTIAFGNNIVATTSESDLGDATSNVTAGSLLISNATLTKASAAINGGHDALSQIDFNATFGHLLTDTYNHHG
jgi:hypothetical protein